MKEYRKAVSILTMLLFASGLLVGQENYEVSTRKDIKIVKNDSIILAEVSRITTEIELDNFKRYYWYYKGKIQSNLGGFHGNLLDGKFELFKKEKLILKGSFANGLKTGEWKAWTEEGGYEQTYQWKEGRLDGEAISYLPSGAKKEVFNFKEGQKHGVYEIFNAKAKLKEKGKYKAGLKNGKVNLYNENGERKIEKYKSGELQIPKPKKIKKDKTKEPKQENKEESKFQMKWKQWFPKKEDKTEKTEMKKDKKERFQGLKKIFQKKENKDE
ncbi:MAG: hypothetical protein JKY48_03510 [Flavobacteriales bacterium]|nr:hypothetical protein [Flavobacteriales bacterium]